MAKKTVSKEATLEQILFNCRNALRGAGGTEKNRDAVIGLVFIKFASDKFENCLLYTSPSPRDYAASRMPSSA